MFVYFGGDDKEFTLEEAGLRINTETRVTIYGSIELEDLHVILASPSLFEIEIITVLLMIPHTLFLEQCIERMGQHVRCFTWYAPLAFDFGLVIRLIETKNFVTFVMPNVSVPIKYESAFIKAIRESAIRKINIRMSDYGLFHTIRDRSFHVKLLLTQI